MPDFVVAFTGTVIFAQMFVLGVQHRPEDVSRLLADAGLLSRSILSALFLVPCVAFVLIALLQPPPEVGLGIALLAAAPGAPLTLRRSDGAGADRGYVASLQLLLALSAIVFMPLALAVFDAVHDVSPPSVAPSDVAYQVATVTFLPALLGWSLARLAPGLVAPNRARILFVAQGLFLAFLLAVVLALVFAAQVRANLMLGWAGAAAVVLLAASAIVGRHGAGRGWPLQVSPAISASRCLSRKRRRTISSPSRPSSAMRLRERSWRWPIRGGWPGEARAAAPIRDAGALRPLSVLSGFATAAPVGAGFGHTGFAASAAVGPDGATRPLSKASMASCNVS